MKHLVTSLLLIALSASVEAQSNTAAHLAKAGRTSGHLRGSKPVKPLTHGVAKGGGSCLFTEDFEGNGIPAGWSVGDQVEQFSDDADNPQHLGTFVDAFRVGDADEANNGGFFDVPDEPPGNSFAYANDDGDPCNCGMVDIGLVTPAYDLTGQTGIGLSVRVWHDGQYASSTGLIQARIGTSGTWNTIRTLDAEAGWQNVTIVLTDYEDQADVQFRFQWDDGGGWGTGLAVDDLCIATLPGNDLSLVDSWLSPDPANFEDALLRNLEYRVLPLVEAIPLSVSAPVINNGSVAQTDVTLSATITQNGNTYGPFAGTATTLSPGQRDTLTVSTGWLATATGDVEVEYTLASSDPTDANPGDNTATQNYTITGPSSAEGANAMGLDKGSMDSFNSLSTNPDSAFYDALAMRFQVEGTGNMAYGIGVAIYQNTEPGTLINVALLDDNGIVVTVEDQEILPGDLSDAGEAHYKIIPFDDPVELDPTMDYEVFVENINEEVVNIGLSGEVLPGGLLGHVIGEDNNTIYVGFGNPALMLRLYLSESVGFGENADNGLTLGATFPNPADRNATIPFSLETGAAVNYQVMDMQGRVVATDDLGKMGAGQHQVQLDVSQLASGAYSFTLNTGAARLSRPVVVAH